MIDGGIYSVAEIALAELNFTSYYLYVFLILMIFFIRYILHNL